MKSDMLPETGYLRLPQIIGNRKANPPIPALIPVGKSTWWAGVRSGRFPKPVKLGPRTTAWRVEDIRLLIQQTTYRTGPHVGIGIPHPELTNEQLGKAIIGLLSLKPATSGEGWEVVYPTAIGTKTARGLGAVVNRIIEEGTQWMQ